VTPNFNELKSLGGPVRRQAAFLYAYMDFCEETLPKRGHETLSLPKQGRRTLSSLLSHAKAPNSVEA